MLFGFKYVSVPFPGILFLNVLNSEQVFNQRFWSFRPLPRDLISQLGYKSANDFIKLGFRPLPGDLISQFVLTARTTEIFRIGFRPLPGDLISQSDLDYEVAKYEDVFPSPSQGSYFSMTQQSMLHSLTVRCFRPLPGDLISQYAIVRIEKMQKYVSVPFPGILFLNPVLYMPNLNWIPKPNCGAKPNPTLK